MSTCDFLSCLFLVRIIKNSSNWNVNGKLKRIVLVKTLNDTGRTWTTFRSFNKLKSTQNFHCYTVVLNFFARVAAKTQKINGVNIFYDTCLKFFSFDLIGNLGEATNKSGDGISKIAIL